MMLGAAGCCRSTMQVIYVAVTRALTSIEHLSLVVWEVDMLRMGWFTIHIHRHCHNFIPTCPINHADVSVILYYPSYIFKSNKDFKYTKIT